MTVARETSDEYKRYFVVQQSEFLECIGRVADVRYRETNGLSLARKIEYILDGLFLTIHFTRREVPSSVTDEVASCSDEEY